MMRLCIRKSRKSTNFIKLAVILYREGIVAYAIPVATSHHMGQFLQGGKNGRLMSFFF